MGASAAANEPNWETQESVEHRRRVLGLAKLDAVLSADDDAAKVNALKADLVELGRELQLLRNA